MPNGSAVDRVDALTAAARPGLVDTHCHIDVSEFAADYGQVLQRARAAGVNRFVVPGVDRGGWPRLLALCRKEAGCHPALGLHPLYLPLHRPAHLEELGKMAARPEVVAIGEVGLDFWDNPEALVRQRQEALFEQQVRIAKGLGLPLLLHARKAHDQVQAIVRRLHFPYGGIVHAFSGSRQQALIWLELGFLIGIGGTITYGRANRVRALAAELPLPGLVLETDAPDIPPAAHRQERNSPEYLPEIVHCLAQLRSDSPDRIAVETTRNAVRLLNRRVPGLAH
ncbi:TatD family hydrolase [Desulfofustis limnaeus]|jgi:TatD DNase family protein|uniref:Uncharacterized protein n=1 Tax=Desulfofustis limnaeus TaxID=2740163 RepID=A0ABM7W4P9_9BACT|nr:TatD family hydrolase [Desulfofustis limnaeus]MDX9894059.1 TatD family hydrolase [Desulfofustis sp.]BDD85887.1 hypothetical protein DPPLL_02520 [Desulfofustis limnaeus]